MKRIKYYLLLFGLIIASTSHLISQNPRTILWVNGAAQTSHGWLEMKGLLGSSYDFTDPVDSDYSADLGVIGGAEYLEEKMEGTQNVLGIGHDYGGIVLRQLEKDLAGNNLTAMILDGTPNQGSKGIYHMLPQSGQAKSRVEKLVDGIKNLKSNVTCNDCGFDSSFDDWINEVDAGRNYLSDVEQDSPIINELNAQENLPEIPVAVLYGTTPSMNLPDLMSSKDFPSNIDRYTGCYLSEIRIFESEAQRDFEEFVAGKTRGLFGKILKFVTDLVPLLDENSQEGGNPFINPGELSPQAKANAILGIIEGVTGLLEGSKDCIFKQQELDAKLEELLRCRLYNDYLAAEWELLLLGGNFEEQEVDIISNEEYRDCMAECQIDMAWGDWHSNDSCEEACEDLYNAPTGQTQTINVFVIEPNDGLLTKTEQLLPSASTGPIHLMNTNHFEETSATKGNVVQVFQDLFNGNYGPAFQVPAK